MEYLTEDHRKECAAQLRTFIKDRGITKVEALIGAKQSTIENYIKNPFNMSVKFMHKANEVMGMTLIHPQNIELGETNGKEEEKSTQKEVVSDVVIEDKPKVVVELVEKTTPPPPAPIFVTNESSDLGAQSDPVITEIHGRDICVMEPFYREVHPKTHVAMKDWYDPSTMRTAWKDQESFLVRTRNRLAAMFLKTGCQWSLWLDHDIVTPCRPEMYRSLVDEKTAKRVPAEFLLTPLPQRLLKWKKTIVSGVYFDRHGHGSIMAVLRSKPPGKLPLNQLAPAVFCGMGCVMIHRSVFVDVLAKFPELASVKDDQGRDREPGFFTPYQRPLVDGKGGGTAGEDEAFFKRASDAGHPCYVDLGCICGHIGECCYGLPENL